MAKTQEELLREAEESKRQAAEAAAAEQPKSTVPTFESVADIDRYFSDIQAREAAADREREEKRVQRQIAARSLSDLGSSIVDMIKASEGAVVSPRQVEQHYARLDDRQKQLYDTYRTRMDLLRKQQAEGAKADLARRQALKDREEERAWREQEAKKAHDRNLEALKKRQDFEREQARLNRIHQENMYQVKNGDAYIVDFGNGEVKEYKNKADGMNVYAAIYRYLRNNGFIPDDALEDKEGNVVPVKTQQQADFLVRNYLPIAMEDPAVKSAIYKIVYGRTKDFRDPLTRNIEDKGKPTAQSQPTIPSWIPNGAAAANQPAQTSTGGAY